MIKRYTLQNMKNVWSEETKFSKMLEIELLICEAWNKLGKIPDNSLLNIKSKAKFNIERIKEIEKITNHDVIAFVTNVSENIGDDGRFIHMGATSSDILDTALALQMRDAVDILIDDLLKLKDALREKAIKYKNLLTIGRTHGIHAEPTSFGLKFALWFTETKKNIERMIWVKDEISIGLKNYNFKHASFMFYSLLELEYYLKTLPEELKIVKFQEFIVKFIYGNSHKSFLQGDILYLLY